MKELKFDRARFDAGEMPTRTRGGAKVHWCAATGLKDEFRAFVAIVGNNSVAVAYDSDGCSVSGCVYYDLVHEPRMLKITVGCRRSLVDPTELVVSAQPGVLEDWRKAGLLVAEHTFEVEE